jgi:hypothetical protein
MVDAEPPVEPDTVGESLLQPIAKCSSAHAPKAGANRESLDVEVEMESNGYVRVVSGGANQHWLMFFGSAKRSPGIRRGATIWGSDKESRLHPPTPVRTFA